MLDEEIKDPDEKVLREFSFIMAGAIGGIFGIVLPWLFSSEWPVWPWPVAGGFLTFGLLMPRILGPVFKGWMRIGHLLSLVMTPLILGVVFYFVITPVGLIRRLFRMDSMRRDNNENVDSFRVESDQPDPDRMERPF